MAWINTIDEFVADLERWGRALQNPKAEWQVYYRIKTGSDKIRIYDCYHPTTGERLNQKSATALLSQVFLEYGGSQWKRWPRYEKSIDRLHDSSVFERVIHRLDFPRERPELDNIYVKLAINKDFEAQGLTLDKFVIVSFHPERDKE